MKSQPDPRRWKALALLCTAFFMVILDSAIVVVALPSIGADLHFSAGDLQWVLSAYLLSFGGLLLLGGRAADLLGRRRVFMVGTGLFALASLACGLAVSVPALIAARVVQGTAAAIMTPTALSIVMTTFEEGAERNKALGIWAAIGGIGATAAWLVGGPITDGLGWQWIFFINVPVAIGVTALSPALLRESRASGPLRRFDVGGAVTITAALVALVYALVGGNLVLFALGMLAFGMPFILTQYAQDVLHYSPLEFGLASVVMPVTAALGSMTGQAIATRGGLRAIAAGGLALTGLGCLLLTQVSVDGSYLGDMFFGLLAFGPGLGAAYVAGSIGSLAGVAEADAGLAAGLNNS